MVEPCLMIHREELAKILQDEQVDTILRSMLNFAHKATASNNLLRPCDLGDDVSKQERGRRLTVLRKRNLVRKIKVGEYMLDPSVAILVADAIADGAFNKLVARLEEKWIELEK